MKVAEHNNWLLELSCEQSDGIYRAWVSKPNRMVAGFGKGFTPAGAIGLALTCAADCIPYEMADTLRNCGEAYLGIRPYCRG